MKGLENNNIFVTEITSGSVLTISARFATEEGNVAIDYYNNREKIEETEKSIECVVE